MSTHSSSQPRHFRASSTQHGASSHSKFSSNNDEFFNENMSYIKRYLSKYEDVPERSNFLSKLQDDRSSSALKNVNVNENSYAEFDQKYKAQPDDYASKTEMSKRVAHLEQKVQELTQKVARDGSRGPEMRQEDSGKINDRFMCIENRVDMMDRKLDKLSTVLESFMQRFQGFITSPDMLGSTQDDSRASIEQVNMRREILHENGDRLPEIKLLENNFMKDNETDKSVVEPRIFASQTGPRRTPSKDNSEVRERVRESFDQSGRKRDEKILQAKQSSYRDKMDAVEPKILVIEQPERNKVLIRPQEKVLDRLDTRESMDSKAIMKLKGSLRSPDTARKRKNVSWSESNWVSDGNIHVEAESGQKRKRMDTSESNDYERFNENNKYEMRKDESDTTKRAREIIEEKYKQIEVKGQRASSVSREEDITYERQPRYMTGDSRTEKIKTEVEKLEEKLRKIEGREGSQNATEKERQLEEKRRKIDEEIQRRLSKHVDIKKRGDSIDAGQKRGSQYESDLKGRSCDTDGLYDKELMARNELINKYTDLLQSSSKKSKNV